MSDPSSGWPARFVVMVQLAAWCTVGLLLLQMGMASLTPDKSSPVANSTSLASRPVSNVTEDLDDDQVVVDNATATTTPPSTPPTEQKRKKRPLQYRPSSVLMITVGCAMLILGPVVLLIREIESRRQYDRFVKVDPPPSYDEVTEAAPRYSSLFEMDETGEMVPINTPPPRDRPASPAPGEPPAATSLLLKPRTNSVV